MKYLQQHWGNGGSTNVLPLWQGSLHRSTWHLAACESIERFGLCCGCPRDVQILLKWPGSEWNQTTPQVPYWDLVGGCLLPAHFPSFPGIEEYQPRLQNTHSIHRWTRSKILERGVVSFPEGGCKFFESEGYPPWTPKNFRLRQSLFLTEPILIKFHALNDSISSAQAKNFHKWCN